MDDWWSYTLSDFLMFSPRTYYRMLERYNEAVWPAQLLAVGVGVGLLRLSLRQTARQGQFISTALAIMWLWVAGAFLWTRYAAINLAATYMAAAFALEALLFVWLGVARSSLAYRPRRGVQGKLAIALFLLALVVYPALAPVSGRPWPQAEFFGIAPDPTVIGTLGLLLTLPEPRWALLTVPLLWCVLTAATLWVMRSPEAPVPLVAGLLVLIAIVWQGRRDATASL